MAGIYYPETQYRNTSNMVRSQFKEGKYSAKIKNEKAGLRIEPSSLILHFTFLMSLYAITNLCTFGARLSVATHFMLEVAQHDRKQILQPYSQSFNRSSGLGHQVPLSSAQR